MHSQDLFILTAFHIGKGLHNLHNSANQAAKNLLHSTQLKPVFAFHLLGYPETDNCKQALSFLLHFVSLTVRYTLCDGFQHVESHKAMEIHG